jgi:hypothetical protein
VVSQRDSDAAERRRQRILLVTALCLFILGAGTLAAAITWHPRTDATVQEAFHELALQLWPFAVTTSIATLLYERILRSSFVAELMRVSGPSIVEALLPKEVMTTFLRRVYGDSPANVDVIAGVLGGEGLNPQGRDLTISSMTNVVYKLTTVTDRTYELWSEVEYSFKEPVRDSKFVIFATCDPRLRDLIAPGCTLPLYEWWYIADGDLFEESVGIMRDSISVSFRYKDVDGRSQTAELSSGAISEVRQDKWPDYLRFFRGPMGAVPRKDPHAYSSTLKIYEVDLKAVGNVERTIDAIESLFLQSKTHQSTDVRFCYWQAPYPCYVERIRFDVRGLHDDNGGPYEFRVLPFMLRAGKIQDEWTRADALEDLRVDSWMLLGHGVALLWRPASSEDGRRE